MKSLYKLLLISCIIGLSCGHSYLTNPISRSNQRQSNSGCRGPACLGPCDVVKSRASTAPVRIARGQNISIEWPRNNHAGGFIRLAWAAFDQSDSHSAFDNNVQKVVCHENGGCGPDSPNNPNGGDSGPANGSSRACKTSLTVPSHLSDGKWTLQWAWWGGAFALGDYYSCVDYEISGGPSGPRADPFFQGGDFANPKEQKCKYFNTNALHACVNEPCNNPPSPGEHNGVPAKRTLWGDSAKRDSEEANVKTFEWVDGGKNYSLEVRIPSCSILNSSDSMIVATLTTPEPMETVSMMGQYDSECNVNHCDCSRPLTVLSNKMKNEWRGTRPFVGPENAFHIYVMYKAPTWDARQQHPEDHLPHRFVSTDIPCGNGKTGPCVKGICWKAIGQPGCNSEE